MRPQPIAYTVPTQTVRAEAWISRRSMSLAQARAAADAGAHDAWARDDAVADMRIPAVQGYAVVYGRPFMRNGKYHAFVAGCFKDSIAGRSRIRALVQHDDSDEIGSTDDHLVVVDDEHGLAFRLYLQDEPGRLVARMVASGSRVGMSNGCRITETQTRSIAGENVILITKAHLEEVSLVKEGAVSQAFAELVDVADQPTLASASRSGSLKDGEFMRNMTASLRRIQAGLRSLRYG